jgi:pentose-5-phosphate-3-epimerase
MKIILTQSINIELTNVELSHQDTLDKEFIEVSVLAGRFLEMWLKAKCDFVIGGHQAVREAGDKLIAEVYDAMMKMAVHHQEPSSEQIKSATINLIHNNNDTYSNRQPLLGSGY